MAKSKRRASRKPAASHHSLSPIMSIGVVTVVVFGMLLLAYAARIYN